MKFDMSKLLNKEMVRFSKEHSSNGNAFEYIELASMYLSAGYAIGCGIAKISQKVAEKIAGKNLNVSNDDSEESSETSKAKEVADVMSATSDTLKKDVVIYSSVAGIAGIANCLYRDLTRK